MAVAQPVHAFKVRGGCEGGGKGYLGEDEKAFTISATQDQQVAQPIPIQDQATRFQGKRGDKQDGKGNGLGIGNEGDVIYTLTKADKHAVAQPIAVDAYNQTINEKITQTIGSSGSDINHIGGVLQTMAIRRLTPKECERLQGFPDDWTKIPYRNKPADQCPDGPRYKACGNSMAVPVMRWIGTRIQMIENYLNP
jgi:site-specific DNA-cytosine methylase